MPPSVNQQRTAVLFLAVSALDIIAILGGWLILHNIAKPLLIVRPNMELSGDIWRVLLPEINIERYP